MIADFFYEKLAPILDTQGVIPNVPIATVNGGLTQSQTQGHNK